MTISFRLTGVLATCLCLAACFGGNGSSSLATPSPSEKPTPAVAFALASPLINEGNATRQVTITLSRSGSLEQPSSVRVVSESGTAISAEDFTALDTVITFAAEQASQTLLLEVLGDTLNEENETFTLRLSDPVNALIAEPVQLLTLVNDDDDLPVLTFANVSVAEGNVGNSLATLRFSLSKASASAITISYKTSDASASSQGPLADYVASAATVVIAAGATTVDVPLTIIGDGHFEPDEQFALGVLEVSNASISNSTASINILNDDAASSFRAGASKRANTTSNLCTGGYGIFCGWYAQADRPNAIATTDQLATRALVISSQPAGAATEESVLIITTSAIGFFAAYKDEIAADGRVVSRPGLTDTRRRIAAELGIGFDRIFIQSDHSHRSPDTIGIWGGVPASYYQQVQQDMMAVARDAWQKREPVELYIGSVQGDKVSCPERYSIDADPAKGDSLLPSCQVSSLYSFAPNKAVDNEFRLLELRSADATKRVAALVNYSPHATVLDDTGSEVLSGDWTAWAASMLDSTDGGIGLATVATLGRTDFNSQNNIGEGDERNLNRERAARARLRYFFDTLASGDAGPGIRPMQRVSGEQIDSSEVFIREVVTNPVFYANYAPFVSAPGFANPEALFSDPTALLQSIFGDDYPNRSRTSIDRSTTPPYLTGNIMGTFTAAFRLGDVFFATAPGEEFPNAQLHLRDNKGVSNAQMHFFLGATNDFLGYMGPAEGYDQVVAQGATYFFCPPGELESGARDAVSPVTNPLGYEAGRLFDEKSCPDHFILMTSPTIGDHVLCSVQRAAARIGFTTGDENPACALMTASDSLLPPDALSPIPSSTDALAVERNQPATFATLVSRFIDDVQRFLILLTQGQLEDALGQLQFAFTDAISNIKEIMTQIIASAEGGDPAQSLQSLLSGSGNGDMARAGVGVVDMTPDVGYCAGQYCDISNLPEGLSGDSIDPFLTHKSKHASYGVQSRLSARALVVEGVNGKRVALIKTDNYLAQDALLRRVGQLLEAARSSIGYEQILHTVTHNHSSSYSSTPAWGVWIFQDIFDPRFFEKQARAMAAAIMQAEKNLVPARMGATTVRHKIFKGNVVRLAVANDGTPAGYPLEYGDLGLVVMRFDDLSDPEHPKPLATWINWGQHPESLDGYELHSADYLAALERFVDRETGVPVVFSQGDVGSAESTGNKEQLIGKDGKVCGSQSTGGRQGNCAEGEGVLRDTSHQGYAQVERNVRFLANDVLKAWQQIGAGDTSVSVPFSSSFVVDYRNAKVPGPVSHPYPGASNCSSKTTLDGDVGVPIAGLPDCGRYGFPGTNPLSGQLGIVVATLRAEGFPVPDHYDGPAFTAIEENLRIFLQTMRLGDVLLASCSCEAQVDLILNLESRTNQVVDDIYPGFDWYCVAEDKGILTAADPRYAKACALQRDYYDVSEFPSEIPGDVFDATKRQRVRAQVHNDAAGWDRLENALSAGTERANPQQLFGNFTRTELTPARGYKLPVGIGHAGDYVGYTVSYREYVSRDSYRKALTSYGPHTADYMVTRLVTMAGAMNGGPELIPEPHDALAQVDEARQVAESRALGLVTAAAYDAWLAAVPLDVGPAELTSQPAQTPLFSAATVSWRGGNTQIDNPLATVEHCVVPVLDTCLLWQHFADMSGEVQTSIVWPKGLPGVASAYSGQFEWLWTANFEAYKAFPSNLPSTPTGLYRFAISGCINAASDPQSQLTGRGRSALTAASPDVIDGVIKMLVPRSCLGGASPYQLTSEAFAVVDGEPARSYTSVFPFVQDTPGETRVCERCSFRPWARPGGVN